MTSSEIRSKFSTKNHELRIDKVDRLPSKLVFELLESGGRFEIIKHISNELQRNVVYYDSVKNLIVLERIFCGLGESEPYEKAKRSRTVRTFAEPKVSTDPFLTTHELLYHYAFEEIVKIFGKELFLGLDHEDKISVILNLKHKKSATLEEEFKKISYDQGYTRFVGVLMDE